LRPSGFSTFVLCRCRFIFARLCGELFCLLPRIKGSQCLCALGFDALKRLAPVHIDPDVIRPKDRVLTHRVPRTMNALGMRMSLRICHDGDADETTRDCPSSAPVLSMSETLARSAALRST